MDQDWILQTRETRRTFSSATWIPLRASSTDEKGEVRTIGYVSEVFACGSVAFPPEHLAAAERLGWSDIGIGKNVLVIMVCPKTLSRLQIGASSELDRYINASIPFWSMMLSSFRDGPLGLFSPISHFWTVETLVLRNAAKSAWLILDRVRNNRIRRGLKSRI